jgi:hypothetical protein
MAMEKTPLDLVTAIIFFTNIATSVRSKVWHRYFETKPSECVKDFWNIIYWSWNHYVEEASS